MKILLALLCSILASRAATFTAASTSYAHVLAAYNLTSAGDTLAIPAGASTWATTLIVSKSINIAGAGPLATLLTNTRTTVNGEDNVTMYVTPQATGRVSISGIGFNCNRTSGAIYITATGLWKEYQIYNCRFFEVGNRSIYSAGLMAGLVYSCTFEDCAKTVDVYGSPENNLSWSTALTMGTVNSIVIEDCTIVYNNWVGGITGATSSCGLGGRRTFRYNTWNNHYNAGFFPIIDSHGNQLPVTGQASSEILGGTGNHRGVRQSENYNNTFTTDFFASKSYRLVDLRGGNNVVYNNNYYGSNMDTGFYMREEDGPAYYNYKTTYPGYDPNLLYIWNNRVNDIVVNTPDYSVPGDQVFIVLNTNLFFSAKPGYTALAYPYPWRAAFTPQPAAPLNLRIIP